MRWADRIRRRLTTVVREGTTGSGTTRNVNVADASNIVVTTNAGDPGSSHYASSRQTVTLRQHEGRTYTDSETVEDDL